MKQKKRICFSITCYSLFLYYLINGVNDQDIIICNYNVPDEIKKNVASISLPHISFVDGPKMAPLNSISGIIENITGYIKYFYGYIKLRIILFIKCFNKDVEVWGQTHSPFAYMFYTYENAYMIEDGLLNYHWKPMETHKINPILDYLLHICGIYFLDIHETLGTHKKKKKIYLTQECPFDNIKSKVTNIDIHQLWNEKTIEEQEEILKIFNVNKKDLKKINKDYKLLLTQPYAESNEISMDEEIKIYKELLGNYDKLVIKPHPNDKKDYTKIFPNAIIIKKEFPIELMELIGIEINDVYTINSTAAFNFKNSNIHVFTGKSSSKVINDANEVIISLLEEKSNNN